MKRVLVKFAAVGAVSTAIDFVLLNIFLHFGITIFFAIFLSYLVGGINGYLLNNQWTYGHLNQQANLSGYTQYAIISFIGLGLTEGVIYILSTLFHFDINIDKLVAVGVVFFWNFIANRFITFRGPHQQVSA